MACSPAAVLFWLSLVTELAAVTYLAIWPIRDDLSHARSLRDRLRLYGVDSNLDVWLLCILHCVVLPAVLPAHCRPDATAPEALCQRQAGHLHGRLHLPGVLCLIKDLGSMT